MRKILCTLSYMITVLHDLVYYLYVPSTTAWAHANNGGMSVSVVLFHIFNAKATVIKILCR